MNSSKNASCRQLFKDLNILPLQSQYIFSIHLLLKIKTNFCLTHKYIKSTQGKLLICTYLQQTWQNTKRVRKTYQLDANNFTMILSHKWPLHVSDIYMSIFRSSYI